MYTYTYLGGLIPNDRSLSDFFPNLISILREYPLFFKIHPVLSSLIIMIVLMSLERDRLSDAKC